MEPQRWTWVSIIARAAEVVRDEGCVSLWFKILSETIYRQRKKVRWLPIGTIGWMRMRPWRWDFCRMNGGALPPGAPPHAETATYWDGVLQTAVHSSQYRDTFLGVLKRQVHLDLIRRWGGAPQRGRVLKTDLFEEAVGLDAFLTDLQTGENVVCGIDISVAITQRAQQRDDKQTAQYLASDVRSLPFADHSFACIVSPSTLDHFSDPRDLGVSLRELARVLEPQGRLIVTVDNRQNLFDPLLRLVGKFGWLPYYLGRSYRIEELCTELNVAGFAVEDRTAILHNPRLVAFALVALVEKIGWAPLMKYVERLLVAAQQLEHTWLCYYTGSFIAVKARLTLV